MKEPNRRRTAASPVLQLTLDTGRAEPLHRQVYDGVRDAILAGRLAPGTRLPSTRVLAADLGVARNTVLQAFEQLRSEGYVVGARGGGTRVRGSIPDRLLAVGAARRRRASGAKAAHGTPAPQPVISRRGAILVDSARAFLSAGDGAPVPFELGVPAIDAFPARLWWRLTARRWRRGGVDLGSAAPAGERVLREAIASYVQTSRGARCTAEQVLVVNGTQQALHLIAQLLLDPGDRVWLEDPGYFGARAAFEAAGALLAAVPVDGEGLIVDAGERVAPRARLAHVTPSHQFPLGAVMSVARRLRLLAWARHADAWIVEDDYDSEYRYAGRPLPCLQGLDAEQGDARVLYMGTFSKTLAPGLRLGYLIVPDVLVDLFRAARAATDRHSPTPDQLVLADFIAEGHYARHVRHVRNVCAERQAALIAAAEERLRGLLDLAPDPAGLHLVGRLGAAMEDRAAAAAAAGAGVRVSPLSRYRIRPEASPADDRLLLGYAGFDEEAIRTGVDRLARALERLSPRASPHRSHTGTRSTRGHRG